MCALDERNGLKGVRKFGFDDPQSCVSRLGGRVRVATPNVGWCRLVYEGWQTSPLEATQT